MQSRWIAKFLLLCEVFLTYMRWDDKNSFETWNFYTKQIEAQSSLKIYWWCQKKESAQVTNLSLALKKMIWSRTMNTNEHQRLLMRNDGEETISFALPLWISMRYRIDNLSFGFLTDQEDENDALDIISSEEEVEFNLDSFTSSISLFSTNSCTLLS